MQKLEQIYQSHHKIIPDNQRVEIAHVPLSNYMEKQNVLMDKSFHEKAYNEILFSHKEEMKLLYMSKHDEPRNTVLFTSLNKH